MKPSSKLRIKFKMSGYEYNGTQVFLLGTVMKRDGARL